jgi:hypothetical protein
LAFLTHHADKRLEAGFVKRTITSTPWSDKLRHLLTSSTHSVARLGSLRMW